jgi:hypothetical protein
MHGLPAAHTITGLSLAAIFWNVLSMSAQDAVNNMPAVFPEFGRRVGY